MFGLIKKVFIGLLPSIVSASNYTNDVLLSNQKCMIQPTLIYLHPNEYNQQLHYHPFSVDLDRCVTSCNTFIVSLCERCPNKEFFLVGIFLHLDWIRRFTE